MFRCTLLVISLFIAACAPELQTTSGSSYANKSIIKDKSIASAAAYEPRLRLPARIGVVRLVYGRVTTIPEKERKMYTPLLSSDMGKFVVLGPLESQMAGHSVYWRQNQARIRELAASRHLDYVVILAFEPHNNNAEALFMDVRTGYPYASVETDIPGRGARSFWGGQIRNQTRLDKVTYKLAEKLKPELQKMAAGLLSKARR